MIIMIIESIGGLEQKSSLNVLNQSSSADFNIKLNSVLLVENSVNEFFDVNSLNENDLTEDEPIYMEMGKSLDNVTNSYDVNYDNNSDTYLFDKSLSINNKKFNFFVDLSKKEIELIFSYLKNKNYDVNKLKNINSLIYSIDDLMKDVVEESIYETMNNDCSLSEKLDLIDALSEIVSENKKIKGSFKDNLIRRLSDVSLNELFSLCDKYEEQYEIEGSFLISKFIFQLIDDFNKLNKNKIKLNEDLKRGLNSIILLKSLKLKDNNII